MRDVLGVGIFRLRFEKTGVSDGQQPEFPGGGWRDGADMLHHQRREIRQPSLLGHRGVPPAPFYSLRPWAWSPWQRVEKTGKLDRDQQTSAKARGRDENRHARYLHGTA